MMSTTSPVRLPSTARPIGDSGVTTERWPSPPGPVSVMPAPTGARKNVRPSPLSGVLDLDDRADRDRGGSGEPARAELREAIDVGARLLRAVLLGAAEARELVSRARVLALLVRGGAVARLGGGGVARRQRGAGGGLQVADELLDKLLLVHGASVAPGSRGRKFLQCSRRHACRFLGRAAERCDVRRRVASRTPGTPAVIHRKRVQWSA